jgi:UDP-N-acetylmuramate dehydrogenase
MADNSAGCCFKNPTLAADLSTRDGEHFASGTRVGAGLLIDRAGLKGLRIGGASVSERHANFIVTDEGATARDVIRLMVEVVRRVRDRFGVELHREVVVWSRDQ